MTPTQDQLDSLVVAVHAMRESAPLREEELPPTAVLAPCTCPDFCERDHDLD